MGKKKVPSAIPVHCLAHCLQLVLQEAGRKRTSLREALELVKEIVSQLIGLVVSKEIYAFGAKFREFGQSGQQHSVLFWKTTLCFSRQWKI